MLARITVESASLDFNGVILKITIQYLFVLRAVSDGQKEKEERGGAIEIILAFRRPSPHHPF